MGNTATAKLAPQRYGIASAQVTYGGPRGIWLECRGCDTSHVIVGSSSDDWAAVPDSEAAKIFRRHGWTGVGDKMLDARCPACSVPTK